LREKQRQDFRKRNAGIGNPNQNLARGVKGAVHDDRRSCALLGSGEIILVLSEGQVARLGAVGGGEAVEHKGGVAQDLAPQVFRDFSSGKRHAKAGSLHCPLSTINSQPSTNRKSAVDLTSVAHYKVRASYSTPTLSYGQNTSCRNDRLRLHGQS